MPGSVAHSHNHKRHGCWGRASFCSDTSLATPIAGAPREAALLLFVLPAASVSACKCHLMAVLYFGCRLAQKLL